MRLILDDDEGGEERIVGRLLWWVWLLLFGAVESARNLGLVKLKTLASGFRPVFSLRDVLFSLIDELFLSFCESVTVPAEPNHRRAAGRAA